MDKSIVWVVQQIVELAVSVFISFSYLEAHVKKSNESECTGL